MATLKTQPTDASVDEFLNAVTHERRRRDSLVVLDMMRRITKLEPVMWGASIVGLGAYHYKYDSGREGDWFITGFSPRKQALTVYIMPGFGAYNDLMGKLGKHKTGSSCIYIDKLEDIDLAVLEELIKLSFDHMLRKYGA